MIYGTIFKKIFGKDPKELTLSEIEEIAIDEVKFGHYGGNIVPKVGNIFSTNKLNIDKLVEKYSEKPLIPSIN